MKLIGQFKLIEWPSGQSYLFGQPTSPSTPSHWFKPGQAFLFTSTFPEGVLSAHTRNWRGNKIASTQAWVRLENWHHIVLAFVLCIFILPPWDSWKRTLDSSVCLEHVVELTKTLNPCLLPSSCTQHCTVMWPAQVFCPLFLLCEYEGKSDLQKKSPKPHFTVTLEAMYVISLSSASRSC